MTVSPDGFFLPLPCTGALSGRGSLENGGTFPGTFPFLLRAGVLLSLDPDWEPA